MEIKATLDKPFTFEQKRDFIVTQNHNLGYEIRETETELQAWGYTQEELLTQAKESKLQEADSKAYIAEDNGYILYKEAQFETNTTTANNLDKKRQFCILRGESSAMWLSKDNKQVELFINEEQPLEDDFPHLDDHRNSSRRVQRKPMEY